MEQELASVVHLHLFDLQLSDNICTIGYGASMQKQVPLVCYVVHPILDQVMANQGKIFYSKLGRSQIGHVNDLQGHFHIGYGGFIEVIPRYVPVK